MFRLVDTFDATHQSDLLHTAIMDVDDSSNQAGELRRIEGLWFEDGNLVLQAGNALYKVYRGALATHSSVFSDMLSFPQPADGDHVEGYPLVRLPDAEVEVTPFLKALFIPTYFMPFPAQTDFSTIYGCLRLGHKYEVDFLRRRALVHFTSVYRSTLEEHDGQTSIRSWQSPRDSEDKAVLLCAISLAREVDALWVLPGLFYDLAVTFDDLNIKVFEGAEYKGIKCVLSSMDQRIFLVGLNKQIARIGAILESLTDESLPHD
ncbi:hypothetical protein C8F01DRAFT_1137629, partial [Mycena amicta]